jgi:hypothetical protein
MQPLETPRNLPGIRHTLASLRAGFVLACCLLGTVPASGATIALWDVASATGQTVPVLSTAANTSATIINSAGVSQWASTSESGFVAAANWAPGLARDPAKYYQFSTVADPGYEITYLTMDLSLFRGIQGANHGAQLWDLYASLDSFTSTELHLATFDISASGGDFQVQFLGTDISAIGTQVGTVTFRLYGYDYTSPTDYSGLGNDSGWLIFGTGSNVEVEGDVAPVVATPEPSTALLAMAGLTGLAVIGRSNRVARARPGRSATDR